MQAVTTQYGNVGMLHAHQVILDALRFKTNMLSSTL